VRSRVVVAVQQRRSVDDEQEPALGRVGGVGGVGGVGAQV
jgi:hypothetical protein